MQAMDLSACPNAPRNAEPAYSGSLIGVMAWYRMRWRLMGRVKIRPLTHAKIVFNMLLIAQSQSLLLI